ncbi:hypothetical protein [Falsirhodobacter xinxiangensis]|uniref:hypothetical protein n=1 Tax=Falsirhodobacter xinxiangensis TaxID=2530049 RepID=UPI0010A9BFC3|nr:hypothetical protein [Rhodobacter xinxiangensis]
MNLMWLLRMQRWLRHPPPMWKVILVICVVAACLSLFLVERTVGWPDWLTTGGGARPVRIAP